MEVNGNWKNDWISLIRETGLKVSLDTITCELWRESHLNCEGCELELGCGKVVRIMMLSAHHLVFQPRTFTDYQEMLRRISELIKKVMEAKTTNELKDIPTI